MSIVVGQGHDAFYEADRLYVLITLPPEPHTFKVVIVWRDHATVGLSDRGSPIAVHAVGDGGGGGNDGLLLAVADVDPDAGQVPPAQ